MDKAYFEEYFHLERENWWFRARAEILEIHIKQLCESIKTAGKIKILNVGAGTGLTTEILMKYGDVTSVEYDAECCKMVKSKLNLDFDNVSITEMPYEDNAFDLVTSFDVLEHIEDHEKAVSELLRVTKQEGLIFTSVPAYMFMWGHHDVVNHHMRRYTWFSYKALWFNNKTDKKIIYSGYFNFFLFPFISIVRLIGKLVPRKSISSGAGSDFTLKRISFLEGIFYSIFKSESFFIKHRISLPFGVSLMLSIQKK
jgi:ubiquinone/menaquinone biosynthesis C-methylase UbiE